MGESWNDAGPVVSLVQVWAVLTYPPALGSDEVSEDRGRGVGGVLELKPRPVLESLPSPRLSSEVGPVCSSACILAQVTSGPPQVLVLRMTEQPPRGLCAEPRATLGQRG